MERVRGSRLGATGSMVHGDDGCENTEGVRGSRLGETEVGRGLELTNLPSKEKYKYQSH